VHETLGKIKGSPIEDHVEVVAVTMPDDRMDQRIVNQLNVEAGPED